ncbi:MAG TPA: hypothetical protein VHL11_24860 [Phototrophicaceae bacterium]|nr:hypothetical protein [Phototrophicaceae bacterium]
MNYVATIGNGPLPKRNQPPDPDVIIPAPPPSPLDNPRASIREWGNVREWVNTAEAAEVTGYYDEHVRKLARENWKLPEDQRLIRVRRRSNRYDVWLPDLVNYITNHGYGPYPRNKS